MKVISRTVFKVLPGKMTEAIELDKKEVDILCSLVDNLPPITRYRPIISGGDSLHTIVAYQEWDSLATWELVGEKARVNPEIKALGQQWANVLEYYQIELYAEMI